MFSHLFLSQIWMQFSLWEDVFCLLPGYILTSHNDFWLMKEYGMRESWTRIVITISYFYMKPLGFLKNDEALLEIHGKLVLYNPREETYRDLVINGIPKGIEFQELSFRHRPMQKVSSRPIYGSGHFKRYLAQTMVSMNVKTREDIIVYFPDLLSILMECKLI